MAKKFQAKSTLNALKFNKFKIRLKQECRGACYCSYICTICTVHIYVPISNETALCDSLFKIAPY